MHQNKLHPVFKIGTYQKNSPHRKTNTNELNRPDRFIQNFKEWKGSNFISGIGKNPITHEVIKDEIVGYIDANGFYCFPMENQTIEFPSIGDSIHRGFKR